MNKNMNHHRPTTIESASAEKHPPSSGKTAGQKKNQPLLSIIVPVYNEQEVIESCDQRLNAVANSLSLNTEIIYVNDGSDDSSLQRLHQLQQCNRRIAIIDLSRNFGKEIAMTAGLDYARGDAVIIIDADLQDPPELIPRMVESWQQGYDIVYMKRASRQGESWMKKTTAHAFYRIIGHISHIYIPQGVGDFRLFSRRAVNGLCQLRESNRFMKGLFAWVGFKQKEILYHRDERANGTSKWNYRTLFNLALEGITSFSTAPLKLASYIGLTCIAIAVLISLGAGVLFFIFDDTVSVMLLLATGLLFLTGLQMTALGILGEYLGRIYMETKNRPLYLVNDWKPTSDEAESASYNNTVSEELHSS